MRINKYTRKTKNNRQQWRQFIMENDPPPLLYHEKSGNSLRKPSDYSIRLTRSNHTVPLGLLKVNLITTLPKAHGAGNEIVFCVNAA